MLMLKLTAPSSLLNVKSAFYFPTAYIVCLMNSFRFKLYVSGIGSHYYQLYFLLFSSSALPRLSCVFA